MRALLLVPLAIAFAGPAAAEPTLKCSIEGNKYSVVIVNSDGQDKQCSYNCNFATDGGNRIISGSITVKAGESKTVDEGAPSFGKLTGVQSSKLDCK